MQVDRLLEQGVADIARHQTIWYSVASVPFKIKGRPLFTAGRQYMPVRFGETSSVLSGSQPEC